MGFSGSILGGAGTLVRNFIQSLGFISGSTGWRISKNGNAEFNNVTIRGVILISGPNGLLGYNGTPTLGNLVLSITTAAGVDSFGNAYPLGINITDGTRSILNTFTSFSGGTEVSYWKTGGISENTAGHIGTVVAGTPGVNATYFFEIVGPTVTGKPSDEAFMALTATDAGNALGSLSINTSGGQRGLLQWDFSGARLVGTATAVNPTTGTSPANLPNPETWHTLSLNAGWAALSGTIYPMQYRLLADGDVELIGTMNSTLAAPATLFATLPAGYFNAAKGHRIPCAIRVGGAVSADMIDIGTGGGLTLLTNASVINTAVSVYARFPIT